MMKLYGGVTPPTKLASWVDWREVMNQRERMRDGMWRERMKQNWKTDYWS